jgi:hypothetical protein
VRGFGVVEGKAFIPRVPPAIMDVPLCTLKNKNGLIDEQMMEENNPLI